MKPNPKCLYSYIGKGDGRGLIFMLLMISGGMIYMHSDGYSYAGSVEDFGRDFEQVK